MDLDPELQKKLLLIFTDELNEQCQVITDGLLALEKNENAASIIETIFRSAHNIKGAARSVGAKNVSDIAHHIESIFANLQNKSIAVNRDIIDLSLTSVDHMKQCLQAFIDNTALPFDINAFISQLADFSPDKATAKPTTPPEPPKEQPAPAAPSKDISAPTRKPADKEAESIRVAIKNLDQVSTLAEEIQATKIAIDDHYIELTKLTDQTKHFEHLWKETSNTIHSMLEDKDGQTLSELFSQSVDEFTEISNGLKQLHRNMHRHVLSLNTLSNSLLDEVRTLRLIPASTLFSTFPRTVRDIAHELNKQVELTITGDSVRMDKMVLERLQDPIIHLLRNAIDHGIEEPALRKQLGKPATGNIRIHVYEQGNQILIEISDDGAGIDTNSIIETAITQHLLTAEESKNLSADALLDYIFRPGFTTKKIITDVSGRGIGLDVVKANIDNLKGHIKITTALHKGTTFCLRVPLTLASERGLLIQCGGQPFVMPTNLVERVINLQLSDIIHVEASQAVLFNGRSIPLRALADILELPRRSTLQPNRLPIIVLKKGWHSVAVFVEEIINEREIVIKHLQPPLTNVPCIAGGTLAGNGQVIVVLNTNDLIDRALHLSKAMPITLSTSTEEIAPARPHILVVDDSITTRTLEKNILENKNYQVTVAVNGKDAWDLLQTQKFALLITDVSMPIMDGFTLTQQVKQNDQLRDMPVIIVTSLGSDAEKKRGIEAGANAYIVKNEFESDKLLQIVEQLV